MKEPNGTDKKTTDDSHQRPATRKDRKQYHQDSCPPQSATGPIQEGRGNTHKAHHHTGRTTSPTSAYANPHPRKAVNNTDRTLPGTAANPPPQTAAAQPRKA